MNVHGLLGQCQSSKVHKYEYWKLNFQRQSFASECQDLLDGWVDAEGDDCKAYAINGWCAEYGHHSNFKSADGVSANDACCACDEGAHLVLHFERSCRTFISIFSFWTVDCFG